MTRDFRARCEQDHLPPTPHRQLILLKDSILECHNDIVREQKGSWENNSDRPLPPEDKLGKILAIIKALQSRSHMRVAQIGISDCDIVDTVPATYVDENIVNICGQLRELAVKAARQVIDNECKLLFENPPEDPEDKKRIKEGIIRKICRLCPGDPTGINAMRGEEGNITTSPEEIAEILRKHWGGVFKKKQVNTAALQIWMEELFNRDESGLFLTGLPGHDSSSWKIKETIVRLAIKLAKNTMPGPDGIPSAAYKQIDIAAKIFQSVAVSMGSHNGSTEMVEAYSDRCAGDCHDFNASLLCCLPKKAAGTDAELGDFYTGENTRPLALVNTDNRIIASAARLTWEPILNGFISSYQQGFLKGRQMLNNVIDIGFESMTVSLKCNRGALLLFDFKAAFPSVAHDFLFHSLETIGLPPAAIAFVRALYDNNKCNISYKGNIYEGFGMECGVRQGCPISPLLFAASVDVLLRKLMDSVQNGTVRAFADDIGMTVEDFARDGAILEDVFAKFAIMSGLELNIPKTVVIPLFKDGVSIVQQHMANNPSSWNNIKIAGEGTYLGFKMGPERNTSVWKAPLAKFARRIEQWRHIHSGTYFATLAYKIFIASTLFFIAQLDDPPEYAIKEEEHGIKALFGGPGGYKVLNPSDAFTLKECFGQHASFKSLDVVAKASKLRVYHMCHTNRKNKHNTDKRSIKERSRVLRGNIDAFRSSSNDSWTS